MIKYFRKMRQKLLSENRVSKYLFYAIGEITLVVIGILIALQLNNLNENRKQRRVEINVLEGIRNDILKDTVDLNYNISAYQQSTIVDSLILEHLINKKEKNQWFVQSLRQTSLEDWFVVLHSSHFEEAKARGLAIISNRELKEEISRLYEFDYEALMFAENNARQLDHAKLLNTEIEQYFSLDSSGIYISDISYNNLLSNSNFSYNFHRGLGMKQVLLESNKRTLEKALNVKDSIDVELTDLKKK